MQAADFVASYFEAWNQQDTDAVADHLTENGTYQDIPYNQHLSRPELVTHLTELFRLEAYSYEIAGEVLTGKQTIAFQYRALPRESVAGRSTGAILYGAEFFTMQAGSALEIVDYYEQSGKEVPSSPLARTSTGNRVQRYAKSGLSNAQMEAVKGQLSQLMESKQVYLQPDLALPDLARELACSVNHVSQAINAGFGMSFFDYLNHYRVRDAMKLLERTEDEPCTVLSIALQVGFNTTSTFYVAFRKVTGKTPAQYRRGRV
jgi:AraC-like DNA-binding protein